MSANSSKKSNFWWYIAAAVVLLIILALTAYQTSLPTSPSSSPSSAPSSSPSSSGSPSQSGSPAPSGAPTSLVLYAGSVSSGSGTYGFGNSSTTISSPGPTLNLKEGTMYTITVHNSGNMPHSWEISSTKAISTSPLFNAGIEITNFLNAGGQGSVTFTPNKTGNFYYVCTVPGHIELGMWGTVVVST